ncbi:MAG: hypothetical protein HUK15_01875 [Bacteroidales bacterium]|nr:hypothetical protein [Bacteroidales bacterium]
MAYLGCDFGIVVLDLKRYEIRETWLIGNNSAYVHINDIDCDGDNIYVATSSGVFKGNLNDHLVDFSKWSVITENSNYEWMSGKNYNTLKWFSDKLFVNYKSNLSSADSIMVYENGVWQHAFPRYNTVNSLSGDEDFLLCSVYSVVYQYDKDTNLVQTYWQYVNENQQAEIRPMDAQIYKNKVWIADKVNGLCYVENWWGGIIEVNTPKSNTVFNLTSSKSKLLGVKGGYSSAYVPTWTAPTIYTYEDGSWQTEEKSDIEGLVDNVSDFVSISVNPNDENHFFISSWVNGLFEFRNNVLYKHYTDENSSLMKIDGTDWIRVGSGTFDNDGNFWVTNSLSSKCLHRLSADGKWTGFSFPDMTKNIKAMIVTKSGLKWLALAQAGGLFIFDDNGTPDNTADDRYLKINVLNEDGELVSNDVYSLAEDKNGYIWVGTSKGIVVYYNPDKVFDVARVTGRQVKVPRNDGTDAADLLLSTDLVTCICVDGGNCKWFGTQNGGAYYTSADGTETIHHFTTENSPIPDDNVVAMSIVPETGEVFFGTPKGIFSYRGTATEGTENYDNIYAFPNPVKSDYEGPITIKGLVAGSIVHIADVAGNVVFEAKSTGGQLVWDGCNMNGRRVATGVYIVFAATEIGEQKSTTKIVVIK